MSVRKATIAILDMAEDTGNWEEVARACLNYMSEDEVADMANDYEWIEEEEE